MADKKKQAIREIPKSKISVNASVENRSVFKELCKGAMDEVIVPRSKDMARDMSDGIFNLLVETLRNLRDSVLYPDGNVPTKKNNNGYYTQQTNYTSFSRPINQYQPSQQRGRDMIGRRPGNQVKYIWVESEEKASQIINELKEEIDNYGKAKVASLYEKITDENGKSMGTTMADFTYGWTDANALRYYYDTSRRGSEYKWFLDLPQPVDITN